MEARDAASCTGQPLTAGNYPAPSACRAVVEKAWSKRIVKEAKMSISHRASWADISFILYLRGIS